MFYCLIYYRPIVRRNHFKLCISTKDEQVVPIDPNVRIICVNKGSIDQEVTVESRLVPSAINPELNLAPSTSSVVLNQRVDGPFSSRTM